VEKTGPVKLFFFFFFFFFFFSPPPPTVTSHKIWGTMLQSGSFDSWWGHLIFQLAQSFICTTALDPTQSLAQMSTRSLVGDKRHVRLTASSPSVSWSSRKCWNMNISWPYGPSWPVTGTALLSFTCYVKRTTWAYGVYLRPWTCHIAGGLDPVLFRFCIKVWIDSEISTYIL
jgi:hypothetical protein